MSKDLNELFEITPIEVVHQTGESTTVPPDAEGVPTEDTDFDYVRAAHYNLSRQASQAMDIAMKIARESEQPRAIETLSSLLKTASEVNRQILMLNKDKADTKAAKKTPAPNPSLQQVNIDKQIVFTGTSSDLNKMLKQQGN